LGVHAVQGFSSFSAELEVDIHERKFMRLALGEKMSKRRVSIISVVLLCTLFVLVAGGTQSLQQAQASNPGAVMSAPISAWSATSSSLTGRYVHGSVIWDDFLYIIGGRDASQVFASIERAPIHFDGTLGNWESSGALSSARTGLQTVVVGNYLYVLGGANSSDTVLNSVEYAPINADGSLGAWQTTSSMTVPRQYFAACAGNDYLYAIGGDSPSVIYSSVEYAPINPDGSLGAWQTTQSMTLPRRAIQAVTANGAIYVPSGNNFSGRQASVDYATIQADGSLSAWATTTNVIIPRNYYGIASDGQMIYIIGGGAYESNTSITSVEAAEINANHTLGTWQSVSSLNHDKFGIAAVMHQGIIYETGGHSSGSYLTEVEYARTTYNLSTTYDGRELILMDSDQAGSWDIHTLWPDGTNQKRLTVYSGMDRQPAFSPDGDKIVFLRGESEIRVMDAFTGDPDNASSTLIYSSGDPLGFPRWSPDGQKIIFYRGGGAAQDIFQIKSDGTGTLEQLTSWSGGDGRASYSPDGSTIAWGSNGGDGQIEAALQTIWLMNPDGSNKRQIKDPLNNPILGSHLAWSPDSKHLLVFRYTISPSHWDMLVVNKDGTSLTELEAASPPGAWSPDGSHVAFIKNNQVWVRAINGSGSQVQLTASGSSEPFDWRKADFFFTRETVDSSGDVGWYISIATDSNNQPHIVYFDNGTKVLKYASRSGSSWSVETVDSSYFSGVVTSLAMDAANLPHISYYDDNQNVLKYAHYNGSSWQITVVDNQGDTGSYSSLALDSQGRPHISYQTNSGNDVKYASYNGSSWQIETVDTQGNTGYATSLALDSVDHPHIVYYNADDQSTHYAYFNGTMWVTQQAVSGLGATIQINQNDQAQISYYSNGTLYYASLVSSSWVSTPVVTGDVSEVKPSLVLDQYDKPSIAYWNSSVNLLKLAVFEQSAWKTMSVDTANRGDLCNCLARGTDGSFHLAYYDGTNGDVKYAHASRSMTSYNISGSVTNNLGDPISGVSIAISLRSTTTANDGTYSLSGLEAGSYTLTPSKTGYTFSPASRQVTLGPDALNQSFIATATTPKYSISGSVQDGSGNPISGVAIQSGGQTLATTNISGTYQILNLEAGSYTLTPSKTGYSFTPASLQVTLGPDAVNKDFTATAITPKYSISGQVLDGGGSPLSGVAIQIGGQTLGTTDGSGTYQIINLEAGSYTLAPSKTGYTFSPDSRQVTLGPDAVGQDFTANLQTYSISGQVVDDGGIPLAGVAISDGGQILATTGVTGTYRISNLAAGSYTLTPGKTGYVFSPLSRQVVVGPDALNQDFTGSPVTARFSISGQVQDWSGAPLAGVLIQAGAQLTTTTGSDGSYQFTDLAPGAYTLTPSRDGYTFTPAQIQVTLGPDAAGQDFTAVPASMVILKATSGYKNIQLSWNPSSNPGVDQYRMLRASGAITATYTPLTTTLDTQYFDSSGLVENQVYCYQVEALSGGQVVDASNLDCASAGVLDLWVPNTFARGNSSVIVPINLRNASGFLLSTADLVLSFDPNVLECQAVSQTAMTVPFLHFSNIDNVNGRVNISTFASPAQPVYGDGSLFWLVFHVKQGMGATSPLDLVEYVDQVGGTTIKTVEEDGQTLKDVNLTLSDGLLSVESTGMLGDVNDNGVVGADDAYLALQLAVKALQPTQKQLYTADANGDGLIGSADVSLIVYYAANHQWPIPTQPGLQAAAPGYAAGEVTKLSLDPVSGSPGDVVTTTLRAENLSGWAGGDWIITYNPALVAQVLRVSVTGLASNSPAAYHDDRQGNLHIAIARNVPVDGDGALATIVIRLGASTKARSPFSITGANFTLNMAQVKLHDIYGRDFVNSSLQGTIQRQSGSVSLQRLLFLPLVIP
jgi:Tol biopolymer transport system component